MHDLLTLDDVAFATQTPYSVVKKWPKQGLKFAKDEQGYTRIAATDLETFLGRSVELPDMPWRKKQKPLPAPVPVLLPLPAATIPELSNSMSDFVTVEEIADLVTFCFVRSEMCDLRDEIPRWCHDGVRLSATMQSRPLPAIEQGRGRYLISVSQAEEWADQITEELISIGRLDPTHSRSYEPPPCDDRTTAPAGSPAKVYVLQQRLAAGQSLWHPEDLDLLGCKTNEGGKAIHPQVVSRIAALGRSGASVRVLALRFDVSKSAVRTILKKSRQNDAMQQYGPIEFE